MTRPLYAIPCLLVLLCGKGWSAPQDVPKPPAKPAVEIQPTEIEAIGWLFEALNSVDPGTAEPRYSQHELPYLRAAWIPPWGDAEWQGMMDFAVNAAASQTSPLIRADIHANGWLMVWNLEQLAPEPSQLRRLIKTWDDLAINDPVFHVPETNLEKAKTKAALLAPHLQEALARHVTDASKSQRLDVLVTQLTKSTGAIYRADFLLEQLLTSVRGKYPEFIQIDFKVDKFTPLQAYLKKRGYFLEQSREGYGDKCAFLNASDVTGKDRVVCTIFGLFSPDPAVGTFDKKDLRTRSSEQFVRNLLEFDPFFDASEWFIPGENRIPRRVLANDKGEIQRVAPPDVVADHTKPAGFTHELEMGMSCEMCHGPDSGYKLRRNDLELLLGSDTDFIGDTFTYFSKGQNKKVTLSRAQAIKKLASRFGDPIYEPADGILARAKRDFVRIVAQLTDYPVKADGPNAVQLVTAKIKETYHGYRYTTVDAERACLELGVKVPPGQGLAVFKKLIPPTAKGTFEDPVIGLLRAGARIKRDDMDSIHVELARRAIPTRPTLNQEKGNASYHRAIVGALAIAG